MENNENKHDFYWYVPNEDNYESDINPCHTCKHFRGAKKSSSSDGGTYVLGMLLLVALAGCFVLYSYWKADEAKLQNCLYIDESGSLHSVKNGQDWNMLDADYLKQIVKDPYFYDDDE